jgi:hypothetical protein
LAHLTGALPQPLHLIGREGLWDYARITGKPEVTVVTRPITRFDRWSLSNGDFSPTMLGFQFGDNSHQNRSAAR